MNSILLPTQGAIEVDTWNICLKCIAQRQTHIHTQNESNKIESDLLFYWRHSLKSAYSYGIADMNRTKNDSQFQHHFVVMRFGPRTHKYFIAFLNIVRCTFLDQCQLSINNWIEQPALSNSDSGALKSIGKRWFSVCYTLLVRNEPDHTNRIENIPTVEKKMASAIIVVDR